MPENSPEPAHDGTARLPELARGAPTNTRTIILGLACFASFLTYVHRYAWGATRPYFKKEYGITAEEMGWLDGAFNLTYALGQFPGGWAGDVFGPRVVIPIAAVLWSIMMIGPALTGRFYGLLGMRLGFGATQAPCYPNLGKVTKSWFPLKMRTSMQGLVASFAGRAGGAIAPLIIATVLIATFGLTWQASLYVLAGVGLLFAFGFWALFRNSPSEHPWANTDEQRLIEEGETPLVEGKTQIQWTIPSGVNLAIFMAASFCSTFADNLFVFYMPDYLTNEKGLSDAQMGIFAGLPIWGGAIGGMFGGVLNDVLIRRLKNRRVARSVVASTGKVLAAVLIAASLLVEDGRAVMAVLFFCKFFSDWSQPTWWGTVTDIGGPAAGKVFGMVNMVGSAGATVAGPAMGYVLGIYGWTSLFLFVGGAYILTAVLWGFVNCTKTLVPQ